MSQPYGELQQSASAIAYSVVVPVYNAEKTLQELHERISRVMGALEQRFEIVFVEDCGRDGSWRVLQQLARQDVRVRAIQLMRNYGQTSATMCGLRQSQGRIVVTLDDDLQHPPEEIPTLVRVLEHDPNLDVVIGVPREKKHALWRRLGSRLVNAINSFVLGKSRSLRFSGFRAMTRQVADALTERSMPQPAIGVLLYSITPRIRNVYVRHEPRAAGRSGYTLSKALSLALDNFLAFSVFPLRLLAGIGVVGIIGSLLLGVSVLVRYLVGGIRVEGWTTLALLLIGLSGFQFFAFGIVGEYLLRILQSVHRTPQYLVRQQIGVCSAEKQPQAACRSGPGQQSAKETVVEDNSRQEKCDNAIR